ncbi:MAG: hypothetical protein Q8Q11_00465 [bacterium]|nr:hypothetical protein [bacterium]MDZ4247809.1 hypothetical protein [Patescibacteria group bacterium]
MYWLPNLITLVRVPVIALLALPALSGLPFIPEVTITGEQAFWLFAAGILSHGLDGMARTLFYLTDRRGLWHELDTAVLSLGLQVGAALWLIDHGTLDWWILAAYLAVVMVLQAGYVDRRKAAKRPFIPIVLIGSAPVWLTLGVLLSIEAGTNPVGIAAFMTTFGLVHFLIQTHVWIRWNEERQGKLYN